MNTAVIVTVISSVGVVQSPPAGATTSPGGNGALVISMLRGTGSLITTSFHDNGKSLKRVNVATAVGGSVVTELNASAGGATDTTGLIASARAGESGGADPPGGIGAGVLLSITWCVSTIVSGRPVKL